MKVIRHDNKCVEQNTWTDLGCVDPKGLDDLSNGTELNDAFAHPPEQAGSLVRAEGY